MNARTLLVAAVLAIALAAPAAARPGWHAVPAPRAQGEYDSVSCPTTRFCLAVGTAADDEGALAVRFDGRAWRRVRVPKQAAGLLGVDCTAPVACTAAGWQDSSGGQHPLALRWNGKQLALQPVPGGPPDATRGFTSVDCTGPRDCTAAGQDFDAGLLIGHWNGATWTVQLLPPPQSSEDFRLDDVACHGRDCVASGYFEADTCISPLLLRGHGDVWSLAAPAQPCDADQSGADLAGAACPAAGPCFLVGWLENDDRSPFAQPLVERWDGRSWHPLGSPDVTLAVDHWGGGAGLNDVSCWSARACTAVGTLDSDLYTQPLVERWDGRTWRIDPIGRRPANGGLTSVSCATATTCTAVGFDGPLNRDESAATPLIEIRSPTH